MSRIVLLLVPLVLLQIATWAIPVPPGATGITGYLPLHTLMETSSIVVAMMVFAVGWNAHRRILPGNIVILACMFFAVGWLDFFHTVSYVGMPDFFTHNDWQKHLSYWLSARFLAAIALLIVAIRPWQSFAARETRYVLLIGLIAITALVNWLVIFHQDELPHFFILGTGLTPLKKNLEYLYIAINLLTALLLWRKMRTAQPFNAPLLFAAACVMAMSEFFFTLYTTMTGAYNVLGHIYKVISYLLIYRAIVVQAIETPYKNFIESQNNLALAVRSSNTGLWDWEVRSGTVYFSPVWKAQLGYQENDLHNDLATWEELLHPEDRPAVLKRIQGFLAAAATNNKFEHEFRMRHRNGSYHWILARGEIQTDAKGSPVRMLGAHIDISDRRQAEERFRHAVEAAPNAMIMTNARGTIVLTNAQTTTLFGYTSQELIGQPVELLIPEEHHQRHQAHVHEFAEGSGGRRMGVALDVNGLHKDGRRIPIEVGLNPFQTSEGRFVLASVVDINERQQAQQRIERLANFDVLTGLPNRLLLQDRVGQAIRAAQRNDGQVAILFIDLDHFKNVNDTLGHRIGDSLLMEVSKRIQSVLRENDTVSRMGGDEFVVVLPQAEAEGVARVAEKLLSVVGKSCTIELHDLLVTPSIGIAMYPQDGTTFDLLYQHADTAMYRAKQDGRNAHRFFTLEMQHVTERMLLLENALHYALERDQLQLHYQPQLAISTGQVIGVEALLRWKHPDLGMISPAEFIPIAENCGQIIPIGSWVLRTAVQQLKTWLDKGLPPMIMAVNLSAVQFRHADLPALVNQVLDDAQVPHEYLELELTESVAMVEPAIAIELMNRLHARGVRMSIDDFGTGYSSLSYLKQFKVYKLKIDQSFVRDIDAAVSESAIVSTIIRMAQSLGFKTIAEGVETEAQLSFLRQEGCNEVQGYLFSKPLPAQELEVFIKNRMA